MGYNTSNNVEEIVIFECKEHSKTGSGTSFVSFIKKVSENISFRSNNSNTTKFTIKISKVVSITTACVTFISKTDELIKDLETLYKLFIK